MKMLLFSITIICIIYLFILFSSHYYFFLLPVIVALKSYDLRHIKHCQNK